MAKGKDGGVTEAQIAIKLGKPFYEVKVNGCTVDFTPNKHAADELYKDRATATLLEYNHNMGVKYVIKSKRNGKDLNGISA